MRTRESTLRTSEAGAYRTAPIGIVACHGTARPRHAPRPRVLLVDDYEPLLVLVSELLTDNGMQVVGTIGDGDQVLAAVEDATARYGGVDVIVMDERLPHMSGLEATRRVARAAPHVPVILYTAFAGLLGDAPRAAGVVAEVSKGCHPATLINTIRGACKQTRASA